MALCIIILPSAYFAKSLVSSFEAGTAPRLLARLDPSLTGREQLMHRCTFLVRGGAAPVPSETVP